jgi:hypothetical protein
MKLTTTITAGLVLAFLTIVTCNLQADIGVTNVVTISFTAMVGNTNDTTNNGVEFVPGPSAHSVTTSTILGWLATDEHAESKYSGTSFPAGSKLITHGGSFQVLDKNDNFLADVSDILSSTNNQIFNDSINSGKLNTESGLFDPTLNVQTVTAILYNDSASTGNYQFYFAGLETAKITDTVPKSGTYKMTETITVSSGTGNGRFLGAPIVVTGGSFKGNGSTVVHII